MWSPRRGPRFGSWRRHDRWAASSRGAKPPLSEGEGTPKDLAPVCAARVGARSFGAVRLRINWRPMGNCAHADPPDIIKRAEEWLRARGVPEEQWPGTRIRHAEN